MTPPGAPPTALQLIATSLAILSSLAPARAQAEQPPPQAAAPEAALVHLDCKNPRLDAAALFASLELELQAQGISLRPLNAIRTDDNFILEVRTDCETRQRLILRTARGVHSVEETFSLEDVPRSSEPRTVALALAELLEDFRNGRRRSSADTPQADQDPSQATSSAATPALSGAVGPSLDLGPEVDNAFREPPVTMIQDAPVEPEPDPGVHLLAVFGVEQRTFKLSTSLVGLDAGFSLEQAELGASLLRGSADTLEGEVNAVVGNLALGYRVAEVTNGRWTASITPRLGLGNLIATSSPTEEGDANTASEVYADVAARVSVNALLWSRIGITLNSEAGYGRGWIAIVDGPSTTDFTGLFLGVALMASLDFSSRKASRLWPPVSAKGEVSAR